MLIATETRNARVHFRSVNLSTKRSDVVKPTSNRPPTMSHSQGMTFLSLDERQAFVTLTVMAKPRTIGNIIAPWRFLLFLAIFVIAMPLADSRLHSLALSLMAGFDIAALTFLIVVAPLINSGDPALVREHAKQNDANRTGLIVLTGIVMIVLLAAIGAETMTHRPQPLTKMLVIATLFIAWLFSNLVYAFHYTHLAYRDRADTGDSGINFPGTSEPVYWDFVYFAFTIGMTFQTSDVTISDPGIRRFATLHALGAFAFNIGVLAFTINVIGSV